MKYIIEDLYQINKFREYIATSYMYTMYTAPPGNTKQKNILFMQVEKYTPLRLILLKHY